MVVQLTESTDKDMALILAWRNNPLSYKYFWQQGYKDEGLISWETHYEWWNSHRDWLRYIIEVKDNNITRPVGYIQFSDWGNDMADIGIYIGEVTLWGKGIGKEALSLGIRELEVKGFKKARADVLLTNIGSQKIFEATGFKKIVGRREGECSYERIL